jgi:hypothetical protein
MRRLLWRIGRLRWNEDQNHLVDLGVGDKLKAADMAPIDNTLAGVIHRGHDGSTFRKRGTSRAFRAHSMKGLNDVSA